MPVGELVTDIFELAAGNLEGPGKLRRTTLVVITGGEPLLQNISVLCKMLIDHYHFEVQLETAGTVWQEGLDKYLNSGSLTIVCSPKTGKVHPQILEHCFDWKYLIQEGCISPGDGLPNKSTQIEGKELKLFRPPRRPHDVVWLQPCETYKVNYKTIGFVNHKENVPHIQEHPLADQQVTSSARDEAQSRRNIELCGHLAMKYNYRVSLQMHKILGLP
jgi:organic radical activating enzyme